MLSSWEEVVKSLVCDFALLLSVPLQPKKWLSLLYICSCFHLKCGLPSSLKWIFVHVSSMVCPSTTKPREGIAAKEGLTWQNMMTNRGVPCALMTIEFVSFHFTAPLWSLLSV